MITPTPKEAVSAAPIPQGFKRFDAVYGDSLTWRDDGEFMRYDDHAAALAASEARVVELKDAAEDDATELALLRHRVKAAEQSLAEAVARAPVVEVTREDWLENFTQFGADLIGKRVRIVPCTGGAE